MAFTVAIPSRFPEDSVPCDMRLPEESLLFRRRNGLLNPAALACINITAWLYRDKDQTLKIHVNPNTTIGELRRQTGRSAATPDAEVGFHSEGHAGQWFHDRPRLRVMQIFTERRPCRKMCDPMLKSYFPGVPWYYYDVNMHRGEDGRVITPVATALRVVYRL